MTQQAPTQNHLIWGLYCQYEYQYIRSELKSVFSYFCIKNLTIEVKLLRSILRILATPLFLSLFLRLRFFHMDMDDIGMRNNVSKFIAATSFFRFIWSYLKFRSSCQ